MADSQGNSPALCTQPQIPPSVRLSVPSTAVCSILTAELTANPTHTPTDASPHHEESQHRFALAYTNLGFYSCRLG